MCCRDADAIICPALAQAAPSDHPCPMRIVGPKVRREVSEMRDYEAMFIVKPDLEEEAVEAVIAKFQGLVTGGGGTVTGIDRWGKRRLAYEIAGFMEGVYIVMAFSAEAAVARELERVFRITDEVIRHLVIRKGE